MRPRRDIFEKTKGLLVSHSTRSAFLTKAESEMAMATAGQHDLIGTHIGMVRPNTSLSRGKGNGKINRKGAKRGAGRGSSQLWHFQPNRPSAPPSAPPAPQQQRQQQQQQHHHQSAGASATPSATPGRRQSTPPAKGCGRGRGTGVNASCAYLGWWCP